MLSWGKTLYQLIVMAKTRIRPNITKIVDREVCLFVCLFVCLIDLILYVPSTIFQLNRDGSSWVEPVLS